MDTGACGRTLLIVEDNPADAYLIREAVRRSQANPKVFITTDGAEAMEFLQQQGRFHDAPRPDLVLLDLQLPRKDGRQTLGEIRTNEKLRTLPVIIFSSTDDYGEIAAIYARGANAFLSKPVDPADFALAVHQTLRFWLEYASLPTCCREGRPHG